MKYFFLLVLIIRFAAIGFCQPEVPEFGKPDMNEMLLKDCAFENGAPALKLYKFEETEVISGDMTIKTERMERIKIFTPAGYPFADIEIPFSKGDKIKNISAIVYNLDETGKITQQKIEKDEIYKQSSKKRKGFLVFTFPGLKPGSVIEYKFTEVEKDASYYDTKFFQDRIPVQLCIFKIIVPDFMRADISYVGDIENNEELLEVKQPVYSRNTQTITRKNIFSFRVEPFMSSVPDNLQHVILKFAYNRAWENSQTKRNIQSEYNMQWAGLNNRLISHPYFGEQIESSIPGTGSIIDSAKKIKETAGITNFIYQRVKDKIKWNNYETFFAEDLTKIWKTGLGSNAEINLIILNLLKKTGVECYPIMVRSREYGRANRALFTLSQFNNVNVLVIDSSSYYILDGSEKNLSYKTPPHEILNRDIFLVDPQKSKWLTVVDPRPFLKTQISVKAEIDSNGQVTGDAFVSYFDYTKALKLSEKEKKDETTDESKINFLGKKSSEVKIDSLIEKNVEDDLLPLNQLSHFTYTLELAGGFLYLDPFFLSAFRKNPFSDSARRTDIDFGSNQYYNIYLHFTLPGNFVLDELPKNLVITADDSSMIFRRQTIYENNILVFKLSFEIKRAVFSKEEYLPLREYLRKIYGAIPEQLILRKK